MTFDLDLTTATQGYEITSISSFMGWALQSAIQANQIYTVEISLVGSATYSNLATVNYTPFTDGQTTGAYESKVTIIEDSAPLLASGVDSIRFNFSDPGGDPGGFYGRGTVIREIDIVGYAVGADPNAVNITSLTPRQIVQRTPANVGSIPITGTFITTPDLIEARAILRNGAADSGASTDWQTIETAPTGGAFSGILNNVPAGGWYDIEVRSVVNGTPADASVVERIGVGDIYLVAGQSNSANFGSPVLDPADDRLSARTLPTGNEWVRLIDPLPNFDPGRAGSGGSAWTRLGPLLTASEDIPIGFVSLGIGNSHVDEWTPFNLFYNTRIKDAVESFPSQGFRAILWHQGERDANLTTTFEQYQDRLTSIITQSRLDAGWTIPWYIAEASFQNNTNLTQEEPVKAAQRATAFSDALVFLGASTDEFHLEKPGDGSGDTDKLSDGVHFNEAGLSDHSAQWFAILTNSVPLTLENPGFEKNTDPAVTNTAPLPENGFAESDITQTESPSSPSVIDWHILSANGEAAADGENGYFNPGTATYGTADPTNLEGTHAATLRGGSAGNFFLEQTRARAVTGETYELSARIGLRNTGTEIFGNARLEILAGNQSLGTMDVAATDLVAGEFTEKTLSVSATAASSGNELSARIIKIDSGANTYLDFDLVELSSQTPFSLWADGFGISDPEGDPDGDLFSNLLEFALGTDPDANDHPIVPFTRVGAALRITRRIAAPAELTYQIQRSQTLLSGSWETVTGITVSPISSDGTFETVDLTITGGWDTTPAYLYRLSVSSNE